MSSFTLTPTAITAWRTAGIRLLLAAVVLGAAFPDTWSSMARVWLNSETFGHGIVVAPISAWLLWRDRSRWLPEMPYVSGWGLPLIAIGGAAWLVAELARVNVVAQYGLLVLTLGLVWCSLGTPVMRRMWFPLAFLFFMVPAGESLNAPLMEATATATIAALRAVGLPVFREGMLFTLPTGSWSVVEACSGLRYVLAAAMLGSLFAWLNFQSWRRRLVFFLFAIVLAVVANWARAWLVVMIGHLSHMRYGVGEDHVWYGWAFFGLVMAGLFWMGGRWREEPSTPESRSDIGHTMAFAQSKSNRIAWSFFFGCLALLVAGLPRVQNHLTHVAPRSGFESRVLHELNSSVHAGMIEGPLVAPPQISGHRAIAQGKLVLPDAPQVPVEFTSAYFAAQSDGYEMIAVANHPSPDRHHTRWSVARVVQLEPHEAGLDHAVREHLLASGTERRLMWSWYSVAGLNAASELGGKAITAWSLLSGQGDHSCMQVISVPLEMAIPGQASAQMLRQTRARLTQFAARLSCP